VTEPQPRLAVAIPRPTRAWLPILTLYLLFLAGVVVFFALRDDEAEPRRPTSLTLETRPAVEPFPNLTEATVQVGDDELRIAIADDEAERGQGLRERAGIGRYDGMLFVYTEDGERSFTMSTVPVPLDIGFYDDRGKLVNRLRMEPCAGSDSDCPLYPSEVDFRYALETLAGDLPEGRLRAAEMSVSHRRRTVVLDDHW
jgi:uncharacterized membrane protein (UPF0127 family)